VRAIQSPSTGAAHDTMTAVARSGVVVLDRMAPWYPACECHTRGTTRACAAP
jgi:hypothetical protein